MPLGDTLTVEDDKCLHLTGYSKATVIHLAEQLQITAAHVFATLALAHLNLSLEQMSILMEPFIGPLSKSASPRLQC